MRKMLTGGTSPWVEVKEVDHPTLFDCLAQISEDAGMGREHEGYSVASKWGTMLGPLNRALEDLDLPTRDTFVSGTTDEQAEIASRSSSLDLVHRFFNEFAES